MKTSQSFPFYPLDFAFGTMTMTAAQVGGYIRALCYQWETGGFPIDENHQKILTGCDDADLQIILGKFVRKKTKYINLRMEQVRKERLHFLEIQRVNGKKGGRPKKNPWVPNGLTQTEPKKTLPSPSPSPSPERERSDPTAPPPGIPSSPDECVDKAKILGVLPEIAKQYWLDRDAVGWVKNGNRVHNWQSDLKGYAARWASNDAERARTTPPPAQPAGRVITNTVTGEKFTRNY